MVQHIVQPLHVPSTYGMDCWSGVYPLVHTLDIQMVSSILDWWPCECWRTVPEDFVDVLNTHELYQLCAIGLKNEWCPGEVCQASEMPPEVEDQHTLADRCLWGHMEIVTKG